MTLTSVNETSIQLKDSVSDLLEPRHICSIGSPAKTLKN